MNRLRKVVSLAAGVGDTPQSFKSSSSSDMLRLGDFISLFSEDTYGYVYNKR